MLSVLEILQKTTAFFESKGIENPRLNAEHLVGHALGLKRMQLYLQFERLLPEAELEKIRPLVRRRGQREPLQYILGEVEFAGLKLKVDRRALIPRPETELLVELIGERLQDSPPAQAIDLGTGTGALALALTAKFSGCRVHGVDTSEAALELAAENAVATGLKERVTLLQSDWFSNVPADLTFDLIVSNPPYLSEREVTEAAIEVREHEPINALVAPDDGLACLLQIIDQARPRLRPGGLIAFETGIAHHPALLERLGATGYRDAESVRDLTGRDRFVFARG